MKIRIAPSTFAAAAAVIVVLMFSGLNASRAHAAGWRHEPWCAFFEYDDVTVDCSYRTFEECYPNVLGGIHGNCGPNPDGASVQTPAPAAVHKPKKHRAQP